ncbi:hypothetical protein CHH69_16885 [Terribacillus saccharophilus]|nr:hypothetical protein CHH69_16885 [Terribacillus saccharophilus]
MRKSTVSGMFIQDLSILLDNKISYDIDEVHKHIENKDVVNWLEKESPENLGLAFNNLEERHRSWLHVELNNFYEAYAGDEKRKWGIRYNGLTLLISLTTEILKQTIDKDDFIK